MQNKILELSQKLIKIPSTKENPDQIDKVLGFAKSELPGIPRKSFISNKSPSLLFYNQNKNKKFKVILNAHLDVVSAKKEQYQTVISGDKLIGRGSLDMKGPASVEILVFKELVKKVNYPLALQLVTDEEIGGHDGTGYQIKKGILSEFVIAGEYTDLKINNQSKGPLWIKVTAYGKSSHGAYVWDGVNAIQEMCKFIDKMNKLYPIPKKESWSTTQNLAKIETTNQTVNKVPDNCSAWFDIRRIPEDEQRAISKIRSILPKGFKLEILEDESVQFTKESDPYLKALGVSIQNITKRKSEYVNFHGASDVRFYNEIKTPAVCFGPTGQGLHTDNEWVSIKSLEMYYKILENFLLSLKP